MTVRPSVKFFATALSCALLHWSAPVRAAALHAPDARGAAAPTSVGPKVTSSASSPADPSSADPTPADPGSADLTSMREQAAATLAADPSPANHRRAAQLAERAGDYAAATASYEAELAGLGSDDASARATATADLERVREQARGTVADEDASSHRAALDRAWAPAKPTESKPPPRVAPAPKITTDDRIVRKWYFWVTLGAIAASAAAVTVIAIKASRDDKPDSLDRSGRLRLGASGLRF